MKTLNQSLETVHPSTSVPANETSDTLLKGEIADNRQRNEHPKYSAIASGSQASQALSPDRFYSKLDSHHIEGEAYDNMEDGFANHRRLYCGVNFDTEFKSKLAQAMLDESLPPEMKEFLEGKGDPREFIRKLATLFDTEDLEVLRKSLIKEKDGKPVESNEIAIQLTIESMKKDWEQMNLPNWAIKQLHKTLLAKDFRHLLKAMEAQELISENIHRDLKRKLVSKQYRIIGTPLDSGDIYSDQPRHKPFHPIGEWGDVFGFDLIENPNPKKRYRNTLVVLLYSHFQTAEIEYMFNGKYRELWRTKVLALVNQIRATRRIQTGSFTDKKGNQFPNETVKFPVLCGQSPDGTLFNVEYRFVDTAGLHGVASYKDLLKNTGIKVDNKDLPFLCALEQQRLGKISADIEITPKNSLALAKETLGYNPIANMNQTIVDSPEAFDTYSKGDLYVSDILDNYAELYREVERGLGIPEEWYTLPRLTIGATVAKLMEKLYTLKLELDWLNKDDVAKVHQLLEATNPKALMSKETTEFLNAKVFGGRCYNNKPSVQVLEGLIIDDDEDGCYGNGQVLQDVCFGNPMVIRYVTTDDNQRMTLREFRKKYGKYLVSGCWQAVISYRKGFVPKHKQDFLLSWVIPSRLNNYNPYRTWLTKKAKEDEAIANGDPDTKFLKNGYTKHHTKTVQCALLNHDVMQWIENVPSNRQKSELLDNLMIETAQIFRHDKECANYDEYLAKVEEHNKTKRNSKCKHIGDESLIVNDEHQFWFKKNLGEMMIAPLICQRKRYPKQPEKHPLNTMFKLVINTSYGVSASSYFPVSNAMVGNHITMRARAFGWYFEKSMNAHGIVTDGGIFNPNKVAAADKVKINGENMIGGIGLRDGKRSLKTVPLFGEELHFFGEELNFSHITDNIIQLKTSSGLTNNLELIRQLDDKVPEILTKPLTNDEKGLSLDGTPIKIDNYNQRLADELSPLISDTVELISDLKIALPRNKRCYKLGEKIISYLELTNELDNGGKRVMKHMQSQFSEKIDALNLKTKRVKPIFKKDENGKVITDSEGVKELVDGDYCQWVDAEGYFDWEIKDIYDKAHLHGLSNYLLIKEDQDPGSKDKLAMRSYNERTHYHLTGGECEKSPAREFMESIGEDIIPIPEPKITTQILKLTEYQAHPDKYIPHGIAPGDDIAKIVYPKPLSTSGFVFENPEQLLEWEDYKMSCNDKLGWSIERFFLCKEDGSDYDPDRDFGTRPMLRYQEMVKWVDNAINSGKSCPWIDLPNYEKFKDMRAPDYLSYTMVCHITKPKAPQITWKETMSWDSWG
ncbi:MAG: hypothetical protein F6K50_02605 [Moorea sp. SIO3I7]|nr:hypothetical protein [Moorena sp. SIO3I7]